MNILHVGRTIGAGLGITALFLAAPAEGQAQQKFSFDRRGGVALPAGKMFSDESPRGPGLNLWQYSGGAEVNLIDPDRTRWGVLASLGAGAATYDSKAEGEVSRTRFSTNGGLRGAPESWPCQSCTADAVRRIAPFMRKSTTKNGVDPCEVSNSRPSRSWRQSSSRPRRPPSS